jgi:alkylated DNA repair dioxygenase AlkB
VLANELDIKAMTFDQPDLFAGEIDLPRGVSLRLEALSLEQEATAIAAIERLELAPFAFRGFLGKRRTAAFGWRYDFNGGGLQKGEPLPATLEPLREAAATLVGMSPTLLEQTLVSEYAPGAGIGWHRDRPQFGKVLALSFAAPCRLRFRRQIDGRWARKAIDLPPRSLYVLDGPGRDEWEHSIPPVEALRYSITFRTMRAYA